MIKEEIEIKKIDWKPWESMIVGYCPQVSLPFLIGFEYQIKKEAKFWKTSYFIYGNWDKKCPLSSSKTLKEAKEVCQQHFNNFILEFIVNTQGRVLI